MSSSELRCPKDLSLIISIIYFLVAALILAFLINLFFYDEKTKEEDDHGYEEYYVHRYENQSL